MPSLFETRGRLQTSATDTTCEQPTGTLDPRRDEGLDLLPFLTCHAFSLARAVTRGEPRSARHVQPQCWFLPLAWVCPTVMPERSPHHEDAFGVPCIVRIDAHGSKDRAKDASAGAHATISRACAGTYALKRVCATTFPSSASFGHPLSPARRGSERNPLPTTDRPRPPFHRRPAKSDDFRTTRMPSTVTTRGGAFRGGIAPSGLHAGSLAHAAHTLSPGGERALDGHCKVTVRSPADP
jgi:hypothetical protein